MYFNVNLKLLTKLIVRLLVSELYVDFKMRGGTIKKTPIVTMAQLILTLWRRNYFFFKF